MTTITLKKPIRVEGEPVSELTLREPTLGCLEDIELVVNTEGQVRINLGDIPKVLAKLADIPPSSARQIGFADAGPIIRVLQDFLEQYLPTGTT